MHPEQEKPRKTKRTYNVPGHAHCLTYSCHRRLPLLLSDRTRLWVTEAIRRARERHNMLIWSYVLMPEHVHLLVMPRNESYSIERFLASAKRPVAWKARRHLMQERNTSWLERLSVRRGDRTVFRFWQPGGGFDRNIPDLRAIEEVARYLHENPVRRGLVSEATQWYWSSARWWAGDHSGPLALDPVRVDG